MNLGPLLFVGLGAMGAPMVRRLAGAGAQPSVGDLDPARAEAIAAEVAATPVPVDRLAEAAANASIVVLMLPDTPAVEATLLGETGLLGAMAEGSVLVDMGSSAPDSTVRLAALARASGVTMLDAPVSGGVARAVTGELAIMVGGDPAALARLRPLFDTLGQLVTHVGPPGSGHAAKALNNLLSAIGLAAAAEVLSVGAAFGIDPRVLLAVLNASTGRNHATETKLDRFVFSRTFDSGFSLRLMVKDLRTALDLAHDTGTPLPIGASCLQQWSAAARMLPDDADHTHIAAYVESLARIELR